MGGGDGIDKVDGCVPHSMVAVDVEELAAGAVKAVEGRLIGINSGVVGHRKGLGAQTSEDAGEEGKRRIRRDMVYSRGERKEYRP